MNKVDFKQVLKDSGMPVDEAAVETALYEEINKHGIITNTSKMSPFWRLLQALIIKPYIWIVDTLIHRVLRNLFLLTANGVFVDLFAAALNLTRKPAVPATGVIRFIKEEDAGSVTVEAGTIIQTEKINGVIYQLKTLLKTVISEDKPSALIAVQAVDSGADYNLAPGYYQVLPQEITGIASVRNEDNWLNTPGDNLESDEQLKDRCRNQFNLAGNFHTDAVYRSLIASQAGLSIDRIFFQHDAPRGPGTANAYLLLDTGVISQPYIDTVNNYINTEGHHGHGDDMRCYALPETLHDLAVRIYISNPANVPEQQQQDLISNCSDLIRCAFRENANYNVQKTQPWSRFSFSRLAQELHDQFLIVDSVEFSLGDIISELNVPRLRSLDVTLHNTASKNALESEQQDARPDEQPPVEPPDARPDEQPPVEPPDARPDEQPPVEPPDARPDEPPPVEPPDARPDEPPPELPQATQELKKLWDYNYD